jgi:hypothetical protein
MILVQEKSAMDRLTTDGVQISWRPAEYTKTDTPQTAIFPSGSVVSIGRDVDNDIVLPNDNVSRRHARLELREGEIVLTDLHSTNGCLIDGRRRLGATRWREGEKLQIGPYLLEVQRISTAPTALRPIEIVLNAGSIVDVDAPAYVVGAFEDINPISAKAASALNEKLGGLLANEAQRNAFNCGLGEVKIITLGRQQGEPQAIVFAGLGPINSFNPAALEIVGENLAKALSVARIREFATVPIGVGAGLSIKDFVVCCLRGFLRGLRAETTNESIEKVWISEFNRERGEAIRREIRLLFCENFFSNFGFEALVYEIGNPNLPAPTAVHEPPARPVYLQVLHPSETDFEFSLLSPEHGAAIEVHHQTVAVKEQERFAEMTAQLLQFDATIGTSLANAYVPTALQGLISRSLERATSHLVVIHDEASSMIPWEVFYFKERCPALDVGVSRLYRTSRRGVARGQPVLSAETPLRMLFVENPTGDLVGARSEADQLSELFQAKRGRVAILRGPDASRDNVLSELGSGQYDLLHYAGHAEFVVMRPEASGLILSDGIVTAADLVKIDTNSVPRMIFLNACESGRMRGPIPIGTAIGNNKPSHFAGQVSLAEGFLLAGIANFIGTYWPVNDMAALQFAITFYSNLLSGKLLSVSMREARRAAKAISYRDWANYLHFGDPLYRVRLI